MSRNVTFIHTPSVLPEPDLVVGFDEEEFTYDDYDDMVRDVRNCTFKLNLSSPTAADRAVDDLSVRGLLEQNRETTDLDFYTIGEFTDIDHKDDCNPVSFVEYAYPVKTTQYNVPRNFQKAMKMSDADLWREAAEKEIKSLQDLNVYKLVPRSTVPPGQKVTGTKLVFKVKAYQTLSLIHI